jgi:hypothetical protein
MEATLHQRRKTTRYYTLELTREQLLKVLHKAVPHEHEKPSLDSEVYLDGNRLFDSDGPAISVKWEVTEEN